MTTITISKLAEALGITRQAVAHRAKRQSWRPTGDRIRGGGHVYDLDTLPLSKEARRLVKIRQEEKRIDSTLLPVAAIPSDAAPVNPNVPAIPESTALIPDWSLDIAKARFRLVAEWRAFLAREKKGGIKRGPATEAYLTALAVGILLPPDILHVAGGPPSVPTLYRWDKALRENGEDLAVLADRRGGWNRGEARMGGPGPEAEGLLLAAWLHPNRPSMMLAWRAAASELRRRGLPVPTYATSRRFLRHYDENHHDVVVMRREGEKALRDQVGPYIARNDKILAVGDVLFADGHRLNFDSLHPDTGRPCRLTLIVWFDWRSRMPVGWEVMPEEDTMAIASALRMGIVNMGKAPKVVYIDNGRAFRARYFSATADLRGMDGLYMRLGIDVQHSKPYAAQTKILERFWGTFNEQCARLLPSYRGRNTDDKPAPLKRAETWHKSRHDDFIPNIHETAAIFGAFVRWYSQNPHSGLSGATPWSVFDQGCGPGVDQAELDRHFLLRKLVTPKRTGFVIAGIRFESDALYGLNKEVLAAWSWADMSEVALYEPDSGRRIGTARPTEALNPLARVFGDELDMRKVAEANKRQQKLRRATLTMAKEWDVRSEVLEALPWMRPAVERRQPLALVTGGEQPPAQPAALPEAERAELVALAASFKAAPRQAAAYEAPAFFASERERYEFLFDATVAQGLSLTAEDAAFMAEFEASPAWEDCARRYEDLRAFYAEYQQERYQKEKEA